MSQSTYTDGPPVPLMVEGVLDTAGLRQLFADIESATKLIGVREKGGPTEYAGDEAMPLTVALERLLAGTAKAVQIRYQYDGYEWTDTVLSVGGKYRVIRCRHE